MAITGFQKSLLGFDPYEVQRENIKQLFAPINQAQNPYERAGAALGTLGGMALFGTPQDPRLQMATEINQTVKSVLGDNPTAEDLTTRLPALQKAFEDKGMLDQALVIQNQIQKQQTTSLEQERLRTQTEKARAEAEKAAKDRPEQTLKPLTIDRGDSIELVDPYSYATIRSFPKSLSPTAQQRLEEGQIREGFNAKTGSYTNQYGEVFDRTEMRLNRQGFNEAQQLLSKLNSITPEDVKQAESMIDYTEPGVSKTVGQQITPKTVNAQVKIAASQLLEQIQKLPPGSASDADMRAAVRDFPGYGDANNLADWVNRTKEALSATLARQQDTYGFRRQVEPTPRLELNQNRRQGRSSRAAAAQQPRQPEPATAGRGVPADVDPAVWSVMTPEEKALWQ
jgi:hypothetical protein